MQILIHALCTRGPSLREGMTGDSRLADFNLEMVHGRQKGRAPGWMTVRSTNSKTGRLRIEWHASTQSLVARAVTRTTVPAPIVGDFINYLLAEWSSRIQTITTIAR